MERVEQLTQKCQNCQDNPQLDNIRICQECPINWQLNDIEE